MIVRRATVADASRIAELSGVLGYPADAESIGARLARLLGRDEQLVLVAAADGGAAAAWVHAAEQELIESGRRCEIVGLIVDPEHRGQGLGRGLVAAVETWARQRGLRLIAVRSNITRTESHPFYERLGYVRTKTQHAYRKHL